MSCSETYDKTRLMNWIRSQRSGYSTPFITVGPPNIIIFLVLSCVRFVCRARDRVSLERSLRVVIIVVDEFQMKTKGPFSCSRLKSCGLKLRVKLKTEYLR